MRIKKNPYINDSDEMQMTPMIDIVFQLLIFFLLSAKFIALEGQLDSYLPKDKGLDSTPATLDLVNVLIDLRWDDGSGRVLCRTADYRQPGSDARQDVYYFQNVPATRNLVDYGGTKVRYDYDVPDFSEIESYLRYRHATYQSTGPGQGLPVNVSFDDRVPTQVVVLLLDICKRVGIKDFTLSAAEYAD